MTTLPLTLCAICLAILTGVAEYQPTKNKNNTKLFIKYSHPLKSHDQTSQIINSVDTNIYEFFF